MHQIDKRAGCTVWRNSRKLNVVMLLEIIFPGLAVHFLNCMVYFVISKICICYKNISLLDVLFEFQYLQVIVSYKDG